MRSWSAQNAYLRRNQILRPRPDGGCADTECVQEDDHEGEVHQKLVAVERARDVLDLALSRQRNWFPEVDPAPLAAQSIELLLKAPIMRVRSRLVVVARPQVKVQRQGARGDDAAGLVSRELGRDLRRQRSGRGPQPWRRLGVSRPRRRRDDPRLPPAAPPRSSSIAARAGDVLEVRLAAARRAAVARGRVQRREHVVVRFERRAVPVPEREDAALLAGLREVPVRLRARPLVVAALGAVRDRHDLVVDVEDLEQRLLGE